MRKPFTMPSLEDSPRAAPMLGKALAAYVRQVAVTIGVPADGVAYEVSDTATAYIGLPDRVAAHPGGDLMLVWDERLGWRVETEDNQHVLGRLRGGPVPAPEMVAAFVTDVIEGKHRPLLGPVPAPVDRATLARMMDAMR